MWQKGGGKLTYNYKLGQAPDYGIRPIVGNTTKEDGARVHPTQKPIALARKFILYWSNEGDYVLDPFCGVGWSRIPASQHNRRFCGIDKSPKYCEEARRRIAVKDTGVPVAEQLRGQVGLFSNP